MRFTHIGRPNSSRQTISRSVTALNHLVDIRELNDRHDWTENFLLGNFHVVANIGEDGRFNKIAPISNPISTTEHICARLAPGIDIAHDLVKLFLVYLRSLAGLRIEGIAHLLFFRAIDHPFDEFIVDLAFDKEPRTGAAALALIEE